jgi:hypothetical protein
VTVESYLEEQDIPYTVFQPLYIYGPHTAKDCEQWFMDRVLRWVGGRARGGARAGAGHVMVQHPLLLLTARQPLLPMLPAAGA